MKLEGSLATFPLRELIDMVVYSSVTGVLNIYGPGDLGRLYFRDSVLYHVERGNCRGLDALAELLELSQGEFSFVSDNTSDQETLYGPLITHLQSAERIATRWRQIRAYVPNLELIPLLLGPRDKAARRLGPGLHVVLEAIDGQSSMRQIAATLGWAEIDIAEAVAQMSVDGLVELRTTRAPLAAQPAPEPAQVGVFDRIRARGPISEPLDQPPARPISEPLPRSPISEPLDQPPSGGVFDRIRARGPISEPLDQAPARADAPGASAEDHILRLLRDAG